MAKHLKNIQNWDQLADSANYHSEALKALSGGNARQVLRQIIREFGTTRRNWFNERRFQVGGQLLRDGVIVKIVADATGFASLQSFNHFWFKTTGISPRFYAQ